MKFVQKNYLGAKQILKFPDHAVAMAVTVDDTGVLANEDNEKIVSAGTIVGGGGVLLDNSKIVSDVNLGAVAASLTTAFTAANSNIKIMAKERGTNGNAIKITLTDPAAASQTAAIAVSGTGISITLATDAESAITTTADDIITLIENDSAAANLVSVELAGTLGSGVVEVVAETALSGGTAGAGGTAEGILMNDVDVTYGPAVGAMIIHGFVDVHKIPAVPTSADIAALKQITFLG